MSAQHLAEARRSTPLAVLPDEQAQVPPVGDRARRWRANSTSQGQDRVRRRRSEAGRVQRQQAQIARAGQARSRPDCGCSRALGQAARRHHSSRSATSTGARRGTSSNISRCRSASASTRWQEGGGITPGGVARAVQPEGLGQCPSLRSCSVRWSSTSARGAMLLADLAWRQARLDPVQAQRRAGPQRIALVGARTDPHRGRSSPPAAVPARCSSTTAARSRIRSPPSGAPNRPDAPPAAADARAAGVCQTAAAARWHWRQRASRRVQPRPAWAAGPSTQRRSAQASRQRVARCLAQQRPRPAQRLFEPAFADQPVDRQQSFSAPGDGPRVTGQPQRSGVLPGGVAVVRWRRWHGGREGRRCIDQADVLSRCQREADACVSGMSGVSGRRPDRGRGHCCRAPMPHPQQGARAAQQRRGISSAARAGEDGARAGGLAPGPPSTVRPPRPGPRSRTRLSYQRMGRLVRSACLKAARPRRRGPWRASSTPRLTSGSGRLWPCTSRRTGASPRRPAALRQLQRPHEGCCSGVDACAAAAGPPADAGSQCQRAGRVGSARGTEGGRRNSAVARLLGRLTASDCA